MVVAVQRVPTKQHLIATRKARSYRRCTVAQAGSENQPRVVGLGATVLDYIASVDEHPAPDAKLRAKESVALGGGNAGNALTAAARLGASAAVMGKVGKDPAGDAIVSGLEKEGISTESMVREGDSSPFTYIIADSEAGTRTCIHTPASALEQGDLDNRSIDAFLSGTRVAFFDGRHPRAAAELARAAKQSHGATVVVEAERPRDGLESIFEFADVAAFSANFPGEYSGNQSAANGHPWDSLAEAIESLCPGATMCYQTAGELGSVGIRFVSYCSNTAAESLGQIISRLRAGSHQSAPTESRVGMPEPVKEDHAAVLFPSGKVRGAEVVFCPAAGIDTADIQDSTGAGDAFNGAMIVAIGVGLPMSEAMKLASYVAASSLRALGPRPALPSLSELPEELQRLLIPQESALNA